MTLPFLFAVLSVHVLAAKTKSTTHAANTTTTGTCSRYVNLSARGSSRLRFGRVLRCTRRNIRVDFEHYPNFRADKTGEVGDHLIGDTIGVSLASA